MLVAILGRQPEIGLAELESVFNGQRIQIFTNEIALIDIDPKEVNFARFGSVIKFAEVTANTVAANPAVLQKIIQETLLKEHPNPDSGKLKFGISSYGQTLSIGKLNSMALSIKKALKFKGYSVRVVPNKSPALGSAQVIHNSLTSDNGSEVLVLQNKQKTLIATTLYEQDIEGYAARDQARPKRDARVGMLPPKLAQTIINLAVGPNLNIEYRILDKDDSQNSISKIHDVTILDCFCGTGVILQEALLMGLSVYGTDLESRMVEYSQDNINWLVSGKDTIEGQIKLEVGDSTDHKWQPIPQFIASETYLGRPLTDIPAPDELNKLVHSVNTLHKKFLVNLAAQLPTGTRICLAVPAWRSKNRFIGLPVLDQLGKIGYNQLEFKLLKTNNLIYARADQIVGRQLVVLTKA